MSKLVRYTIHATDDAREIDSDGMWVLASDAVALEKEHDALLQYNLELISEINETEMILADEQRTYNLTPKTRTARGVAQLLDKHYALKQRVEELEGENLALEHSLEDILTSCEQQLDAEHATREKAEETLYHSRICSTCGDSPHASGLICVCEGTGLREREVAGLRLAVFHARERAEKAEAACAVMRELLFRSTMPCADCGKKVDEHRIVAVQLTVGTHEVRFYCRYEAAALYQPDLLARETALATDAGQRLLDELRVLRETRRLAARFCLSNPTNSTMDDLFAHLDATLTDAERAKVREEQA